MSIINHIPEIPENQKYWFIRTNAGEYYDHFVNEGFVGIGWNKVGLESFKDNRPLDEIIRENYSDENRPNHVANQIRTLVQGIKKGDIVLIPSAKSTYIHFGIVEDDAAYEEDIPVELEDIENHPELEFNYEGLCPYIKRRKINWLKVRKRDNLDPQLFRLIYSQHTISSADQYAEHIDRALYDFFIKGDQCHMVLHVEKKGNIKGNHLVRFMSDLLQIADNNKTDNKDEVDMKVSVQSPGTIELIGYIPVIVITSVLVVAVLGGRTKFLGMELDTPGIIGRLLEWKEKTKEERDAKEIKEEKERKTEEVKVANDEEPKESSEVKKVPVDSIDTDTTEDSIPLAQKQRLIENAENLDIKLPENLEITLKQYLLEAKQTSSIVKNKVKEEEC